MKEKEEAAKIGRSRASSSKSQTEGAACVRVRTPQGKIHVKKVVFEKEKNRMVQSERDNRSRVLLETNSGKWKIGELSKGGAD